MRIECGDVPITPWGLDDLPWLRSGQRIFDTTTPCLHFKPLDLRPRSLTFYFVSTRRVFLFWILVHPTRPWRCHDFTKPWHDFVLVAMPTRRSRAWERRVSMGPHRQGPRRPGQVDPTCQKPRRPASGPGDLIHDPGNLGRLLKTLSRSWRTRRACGARPPQVAARCRQ
jgi:hypothetical protein